MNSDGEVLSAHVLTSNELTIRTRNKGNEPTFEYSIDGETFQRFGPEFTLRFGMWTGDRLGFFCWNERDDSGYLDVDYFHYDYDGPKAANTREVITGK